MEEIFITELFFKDTKKHSYKHFKSLEGARKYAQSWLGYINIIVKIYPLPIYD